jgi:hypothetical protein
MLTDIRIDFHSLLERHAVEKSPLHLLTGDQGS